MGVYRYSNWDGQQDFPDLDQDRLLVELEHNLTAYGDLATALWKMQREGVEDSDGKHLAGNRELYQMLERKKRELQENFDFTANARALRHQLDKIIENENVADLPEDIEQQLEFLKNHLFSNPDALEQLKKLLDAIQQNSLEPIGGSGNKPVNVGRGKSPDSRNASQSLSLKDTLRLLSLLQR